MTASDYGLLVFQTVGGTTNGSSPALDRFYSITGSGAVVHPEPAPTGFLSLLVLHQSPRGSAAVQRSAADDVRRLHDASGLTWDQLGRLFGVSRRTVHLWANGSRMNSQNAEAMARAIRIVRDLAGRTPAERRADLLAHGPDGMSVFDRFVTARERTHEPINAPAFKAVDLLDSLHDRGDEIA